jgi:ComF family protein
MFTLKVDGLMAALIPKLCIFCHQPSGQMHHCAGCNDDLPWIRAACKFCGAPVPTDFPDRACAVCRVPLEAIDRMLSALIYEYPVDCLVTRAKFKARTDAARVLGELLSAYLREQSSAGLLDTPDLIIPVPLHRKRLARRGFNQALEIALPVAAALGLPLQRNICRRIRHTCEQTALTGVARYHNMRDAFHAAPELSGRHVAIIDDVVTTGSTVAAMATALQSAGASKIQVWSVARTHRETGFSSLKGVVERNTGE